MRKVFQNRDLKRSRAKRKNVLLFSLVGIMVMMLIISAAMSIDMKGAIKRLNMNNEELPDVSEMTEESETKEQWAISVENRLERIEQESRSQAEEMGSKIVEKIKQDSDLQFNMLTGKLEKIGDKLSRQQQQIQKLQKETAALKVNGAANNIALQEQIEKVAKQYDQVSVIAPPPPLKKDNEGGILDDLDIAAVPRAVKQAVMPQQSKQLTYSVQTVENSFAEANASAETKELTKEEIAAMNTYEIVTGFSEAYMITGAVAPLFGGRNGGGGGAGGGAGGSQMLPVPVLLEAEGDLIMPNDTIGSVDKCMLIGTAVGNASSSSIDVRLEKMSCIVAGGKKIIDGKIQGWLVSESGTPGIPATMVYRAGDYISRMIASGVLEGLSQGFMNAASAGNYGNSQGGIVYAGAANGAGQGVSNSFSKLADFYLNLAEATLPMLEAKGGRTVSMVLMGGDKFQLRDVNLLDTREVDAYVNEFVGENE